MPNLTSILKSEISRLARKEIRSETEALKKSNARFRLELATLKQQLRALQLELKQVRRNAVAPTSVTSIDEEAGFKFRATRLKAHRSKLSLSAKDYGLLVGASALSIYKWEDEKVAPRPAMLPRIAAAMKLGKREALRRLEELRASS